MKSLNQNGFTHVAIVAAVVVVAAIGGVGYFVVNKNDSKSPSNSSSSTASNSSGSSKPTDEEAVKTTAKDHFALVYAKKIEDAYQTTCQDFKDLTTYGEFQSYLANPGFKTIDLSAVEYTSVDVQNIAIPKKDPSCHF